MPHYLMTWLNDSDLTTVEFFGPFPNAEAVAAAGRQWNLDHDDNPCWQHIGKPTIEFRAMPTLNDIRAAMALPPLSNPDAWDKAIAAGLRWRDAITADGSDGARYGSDVNAQRAHAALFFALEDVQPSQPSVSRKKALDDAWDYYRRAAPAERAAAGAAFRLAMANFEGAGGAPVLGEAKAAGKGDRR